MPPDQPPPAPPRQSEHLGERVQHLHLLLLLGIPVFLILTAIEVKLWIGHTISGLVFLLLLPVNLVAVVAVSNGKPSAL